MVALSTATTIARHDAWGWTWEWGLDEWLQRDSVMSQVLSCRSYSGWVCGYVGMCKCVWGITGEEKVKLHIYICILFPPSF